MTQKLGQITATKRIHACLSKRNQPSCLAECTDLFPGDLRNGKMARKQFCARDVSFRVWFCGTRAHSYAHAHSHSLLTPTLTNSQTHSHAYPFLRAAGRVNLSATLKSASEMPRESDDAMPGSALVSGSSALDEEQEEESSCGAVISASTPPSCACAEQSKSSPPPPS
jgi:hypothetical protein